MKEEIQMRRGSSGWQGPDHRGSFSHSEVLNFVLRVMGNHKSILNSEKND
jgi:hypothetical protein